MFFFKQKTAYEMRISDWSSDVCSSDLPLPCTPRGVIELLLRNGYDLTGKNVVVVGRGVTIGRTIGLLLTRREINATVTLTHTGTVEIGRASCRERVCQYV